MATGERTLAVRIMGDVSNLQRALGQVTGSMSALGLVAQGAAAVGIYQAVQAASDLEEQTNKVKVVFDESAESILQWAEGTATVMGVSERKAVEMAGTFGALFTTMGIGEEQAASLSMGLIQLSADMASFNNASPEEALAALRSGLVGEQEPLRRFGVRIDEATIKQKALEMGLIESTKSIDQASRAQAAYALIMEQTAVQQGDFARTSDSLANQQRVFAAQVDNAKVALGEGLLPSMTTVMQSANGLLGMFTALPSEVKQTAGAVMALGTIAAIAHPKLVAFQQSMAQSAAKNGATHAFSGALSRGAGILAGPWGLALGAGIGLLGLFAAKQKESEASTRAAAEALDFSTKAMTASNVQTIITNDEYSKVIGQLESLGVSAATTANALLGNERAQAAMNKAIAEYRSENPETTLLINEVVKAYEEHKAVIDETREATDEAAEVTAEATGEVEQAITAYDELTQKVQTLRKAYDALIGVHLSEEKAQLAIRNGLAELERGLKDGTKTLDINTQAGRDNREAIVSQVDKVWDLYDAILKETGSRKKATQAANEQIDAIVRAAREAGFEKDEVDKLIRSLGFIPNKKETKFSFPGLEDGIADTKELTGWLKGIPTWATLADAAVDAVSPPGRTNRASGGFIWGPGTETSDSIPAMLSRGEYVIRAKAVQKYGRNFLDMLNSGILPGFASGGSVGQSGPGYTEPTRSVQLLLQKLENTIDKLAGELKELRKKRQQMVQGSQDMATGSLSGLFGVAGSLTGGFTTGHSVAYAASVRVRMMKQFIGNMKKLQGNLPRPLLRELLESDLESGLQMSTILVNDKNSLKLLSASYAELDKLGTQLGKWGGDTFYGKRIREKEKELDDFRRARDRVRGLDYDAKVEVHVHGSVITERELTRKLTPAIRDALKEYGRRKGEGHRRK